MQLPQWRAEEREGKTKTTKSGKAQLAEPWTNTLLMQLQFPVQQGIFLPKFNSQCSKGFFSPSSIPSAARDFSPQVQSQCRLSYGVHTPPCAIACIIICVQVELRSCSPCQILVDYGHTDTLKHPECTIG